MVSLAGIIIYSDACTASSIAVVVKILSKLEDANKKLTQVSRIYYEMKVYVHRLNEFFSYEEMELDFIKYIDDYTGDKVTHYDNFLTNRKSAIEIDNKIACKLDKIIGAKNQDDLQYALVIRNGNFHWKQPWETIEKREKAAEVDAKQKAK